MIRRTFLGLLAALCAPPLLASGPAYAQADVFGIVLSGAPARCDTAGTALVNAMTAPPSRPRKRLICALVNSLEASGVWAKLDALWVMAAANSQAANLNWKSPSTFTLTTVNGPTFTADRGYNGDGVTSYVNTNFNPATNGVNYTQNSASAMVWSRTSAAAVQGVLGNVNGTSDVVIVPRSTTADTFRVRINDITTMTATNTDGRGFYVINRSGASARQSYRNATQMASDAQASIAVSSTAFIIGGGSTSTLSTTQASAAAIGGSLSATDEANFYSAINTYLTAIGAAP